MFYSGNLRESNDAIYQELIVCFSEIEGMMRIEKKRTSREKETR